MGPEDRRQVNRISGRYRNVRVIYGPEDVDDGADTIEAIVDDWCTDRYWVTSCATDEKPLRDSHHGPYSLHYSRIATTYAATA